MDKKDYDSILAKNKAKEQLILMQEKAREALQHFDEDFEFKGFDEATEYPQIACPICCEIMNTPERKPIQLFPCGHTICESCLKMSQKNYYMKCGLCRAPYKSQAVNTSLWNIILSGEYKIPKNETNELPKVRVTSKDRLEILEPKLSEAEEKLKQAKSFEDQIKQEYESVLDELKFDTMQREDYARQINVAQNQLEMLDESDKKIKDELHELVKQYDKLKIIVEATENVDL